MEVVAINPSDYGIEKEKSVSIESGFGHKVVEYKALLGVYENIVSKEISKEVSLEAGDLRRKLVKIRTSISDVHKTEKAYYLNAGRYVDAIKNKLTLPIEQMEVQLIQIEKHFELLEQKRINQLQEERTAKISEFTNDIPLGIGNMTEEMFDIVLSGVKAKAIEAKAKLEQEQKEDEDRRKAFLVIQERKEKLRPFFGFYSDADFQEINDDEGFNALLISVSNAKAKKEAEDIKVREDKEKLEKEAAAQKKQLDDRTRQLTSFLPYIKDISKLLKISDADFKKQLVSLTEQKKEDEKSRKEQADRLAAAESESARIALEIKAKKEQEEKQKAETEKLAKAPVKERLKAWVCSFSIDKDPVGDDVGKDIEAKFEAFKYWATAQIENL